VCVLERGRRWPRTGFPRTPVQVASEAFWDMDARRFGLIEYGVFDRMHVIHGSGVGGGFLHYFNVHVRPPAEHLDDPRWPAGFDLESLDPYYRLAHDMLDAAPLSPPDGRDLPTRTEVFRDACRTARPRAGVGEHCCLHRARNGATRTAAANSCPVITRAIAAWAARRVRRRRSISTTLRSPSGVVNDRGAVHGYPDLFVVDGSIVPTALSRNPTATISALAERADST
jgi:choline dehydrogenase-like flavoprotein